jgi:L-malate glycosyltransferase
MNGTALLLWARRSKQSFWNRHCSSQTQEALMPIKILKFLTLFAVGGTERQFTYVTKGLDRSRFDVHVGCLSREGKLLKEIEALNVPISEYRISCLYGATTMRRQWQFAQSLRREGVRLVHAYGFYPNVFCVPPARLAGCATIASVRDTGVFTSQIKLKSLAQKTACRMADRVIANSIAVRDWLTSLGMKEKQITVIPNGIIVPERTVTTDVPVRRQLGIPPNAPLIAVVCRLNKNKGVEYFLQAAVTVSRQFPEARFLIVGGSYFDASYQPSLERFATELGLKDRVMLTGERSDIPKLLQEVDLSVLPSLSEGLSNSLLEAMAARVPVVATNVGGNPEVVLDGRTGLLVPPRDPDALANAMSRILQSPETAKKFGDAGYDRVKSQFSLEATLRRTEDLYMSVLEEKKWQRARMTSEVAM